MKQCTKCKKEKKLSEFYAHSIRKDGYNSMCKKCHNKYTQKYRRKYLFKTKYGITEEEYNKMHAAQNGKCKICNRHTSKFKRDLAVDHNHKTGKVRGLLCVNCNTSIGLFDENIEVLQNTIKYLLDNSV